MSDSRWLKLRATRSSMLQLARAEISVSRLYRRSRSVSCAQAARAEMSATSFRIRESFSSLRQLASAEMSLNWFPPSSSLTSSPHRARAEMSEMLLQLKSNVWIWVQRARAVMSSTRHQAKSAGTIAPSGSVGARCSHPASVCRSATLPGRRVVPRHSGLRGTNDNGCYGRRGDRIGGRLPTTRPPARIRLLILIRRPRARAGAPGRLLRKGNVIRDFLVKRNIFIDPMPEAG
jgi:hypothetical protein